MHIYEDCLKNKANILPEKRILLFRTLVSFSIQRLP